MPNTDTPTQIKKQCTVVLPNGERCPKPVYAKEMCNPHYNRMRRHGDPLGAGPRTHHQPVHEAEDGTLFVIALNNGMVISGSPRIRWALEEFTWTAKKVSKPGHTDQWYAASSYCTEGDEKQGPNVYLHVLTNPPLPKGLQWDHIDHNGLNCTDGNLHAVTASRNQANRRKSATINGKPPSSQYLGVSWHKASQSWRWAVKMHGVDSKGGYCKDEIEAARRYDAAKRSLFGDIITTNFPLST